MVIPEPPAGKKGGVTSCSNLTSGGSETSCPEAGVACTGFFSDMYDTSVSPPKWTTLRRPPLPDRCTTHSFGGDRLRRLRAHTPCFTMTASPSRIRGPPRPPCLLRAAVTSPKPHGIRPRIAEVFTSPFEAKRESTSPSDGAPLTQVDRLHRHPRHWAFRRLAIPGRPFLAQLMSTWPDSAIHQTRVVGENDSAVVFFPDSPELFGRELRGLGAIDFRRGMVVRRVDHRDGRSLTVKGVADRRVTVEFPLTSERRRLLPDRRSGSPGGRQQPGGRTDSQRRHQARHAAGPGRRPRGSGPCTPR